MATIKEIRRSLAKLRIANRSRKGGLHSKKSVRQESQEAASWRKYASDVVDQTNSEISRIIKMIDELLGN
jgi:hypothetical protein